MIKVQNHSVFFKTPTLVQDESAKVNYIDSQVKISLLLFD